VELATDQLVRLSRIAAPLGMADDDPRGEPCKHGRGDLTREGTLELVVDVLGPDADVRVELGQGLGHDREADERWADHARDTRLSGPPGDRAR
jgi:hypothetical protein